MLSKNQPSYKRLLTRDVPNDTQVYCRFQFPAGYQQAVGLGLPRQTAHVLEHVITSSTSAYPDKFSYNEDLTRYGARSNAATGSDFMDFKLWTPDYDWQRAARLRTLTFTRPNITQDDLDRERENVRCELRRNLNNNSRVKYNIVMPALGNRNIAPLEQQIDELDSITLADLQQLYDYAFNRRNFYVAIGGNLAVEQTTLGGQPVLDIEQVLENLSLPQSNDDVPLVSPQTLYAADPVLIVKKEQSTIDASLHFAVNRVLDDAERVVLDVLWRILVNGYTSRIFGKAREQGLAYSCDLFFNSGYDIRASLMTIGTTVVPDKLRPMIQLIVEQLADIVDGGLSDNEVEHAKQYIAGMLYSQRPITAQAVINRSCTNEWRQTGHILTFKHQQELVQQVTTDQVTKLAREFIRSGIWTTCLVGNTDDAASTWVHQQTSQLIG